MPAAHPLDRPVWASLDSHHAPLAAGGPLARRYLPQVNVFASSRDDSEAALTALAALVAPGEQVFVIQAPPVAVPPGMVAEKNLHGVQMTATATADIPPGNEPLVTLTDGDAADMIALARLTQPGPFLSRTHTMGRFLGIRVDGRLAAMAGERFRFPGFTEVSGVCTHPDFRGRGFARRLSAAVATAIEARGEQPFLHSWKSNHAAIALYASLGFQIRTEVHVAILQRPQPDAADPS